MGGSKLHGSLHVSGAVAGQPVNKNKPESPLTNTPNNQVHKPGNNKRNTQPTKTKHPE